ncbi:hypothetical protein D3C72_2373120 [compost metagenome]
MKTRDERFKYVPRHKLGHFIDIYSQPVEDFTKAATFLHQEDLEKFLFSRFGPDDPRNFRILRVKCIRELEVEPHV